MNLYIFYLQHNELETENMQYLALKLGCCTTSLCKTLKLLQHRGVTSDLHGSRRLPLIVLSTVADIIGKLKCLVSWFDRQVSEQLLDYFSHGSTLTNCIFKWFLLIKSRSVNQDQLLLWFILKSNVTRWRCYF